MTLDSLFQDTDCPAPKRVESPAERGTRVRREAAVIAKGHADIEAGLGIEDDDLEAWLDQLDRVEDASLPMVEG